MGRPIPGGCADAYPPYIFPIRVNSYSLALLLFFPLFSSSDFPSAPLCAPRETSQLVDAHSLIHPTFPQSYSFAVTSAFSVVQSLRR